MMALRSIEVHVGGLGGHDGSGPCSRHRDAGRGTADKAEYCRLTAGEPKSTQAFLNRYQGCCCLHLSPCIRCSLLSPHSESPLLD